MPDSQSELERTPLSQPESLRVRCPTCRKLYLVQFADIQEAKPRFECVQCRDRFWIALSEMNFATEVDGIPIQKKSVPVKPSVQLVPCPKCNKMTPKHKPDCVNCGVVLDKVKDLEFKESLPRHSARLRTLWQGVISTYEAEARHDEFIRACQAENSLAYAGAVYSQMAKLMPMDEITRTRLNQVKALADLMVPEQRTEAIRRVNPGRLWQIPLFGGVICVMVGLALAPFRNIAGVGAALLFLAFTLRRR